LFSDPALLNGRKHRIAYVEKVEKYWDEVFVEPFVPHVKYFGDHLQTHRRAGEKEDLGCVWFEPQQAPPKSWHDQTMGMTKILARSCCLDYSHCPSKILVE
jgi:hypothetical protein